MAQLKTLARIQALVWVLIYGGLLCVVLGLAVRRSDVALGWSMLGTGGCLTALGVLVIYLRSLLKETHESQ